MNQREHQPAQDTAEIVSDFRGTVRWVSPDERRFRQRLEAQRHVGTCRHEYDPYAENRND